MEKCNLHFPEAPPHNTVGMLEGSPRTTVRNVAHDCVPTGPPVSLQPHSLKGESAAWVDERLEEEVARGQLVRGSSAWGSPPFPTKEAPAHKKHRKRRLVVDYRRVNARVLRSTYYCRKATDVLARHRVQPDPEHEEGHGSFGHRGSVRKVLASLFDFWSCEWARRFLFCC